MPNLYSQLTEEQLGQLLTTHRQNLADLTLQAAKFGLLVPSHIKNSISDEEQAIAAIGHELAQRNGNPPMPNQAPPSRRQGLSDSSTKILVAIIGAIAVIIAGWFGANKLTSSNTTPLPPQTGFDYQVRVRDQNTSDTLATVKITIETVDQAPLDEYTDSNGFARIRLSERYAGKPGRLSVEAPGYTTVIKNINLNQGELPDTVLLQPE
jgi:hypothetical protein